jgi:hypothetical protein
MKAARLKIPHNCYFFRSLEQFRVPSKKIHCGANHLSHCHHHHHHHHLQVRADDPNDRWPLLFVFDSTYD